MTYSSGPTRGRRRPGAAAKPKKRKARKSRSKTVARHGKKNPNWITPAPLVEIIRSALGWIDLDPFSSIIANETIKAERFFTAKAKSAHTKHLESPDGVNGFAHPWIAETLSINPPGGMILKAWKKLVEEFLAGRTRTAIWIGFSVEQLCLLADEPLHPLNFSYVFLRKRISFVRENGTTGAPSHSNYICALGMDHEVFKQHFGHLGHVGHGATFPPRSR